MKRVNLTPRYLLALIATGALLVGGGVAWAAGNLVVTPQTNLSNGQSVSVSGSGLAANSTGALLECNNDPNQPTINVAGNPVPVSCTNPLSKIVTTTEAGDLATTSFVVKTGTVGPPATGTDSSGGNAATDATAYPCPPTAAQLAAGYFCEITFGDAGGDDLSQQITFVGHSPSPTPSTMTTPSCATTAAGCTTGNLPKTGGTTDLVAAAGLVAIGYSLQAYLRSKRALTP